MSQRVSIYICRGHGLLKLSVVKTMLISIISHWVMGIKSFFSYLSVFIDPNYLTQTLEKKSGQSRALPKCLQFGTYMNHTWIQASYIPITLPKNKLLHIYFSEILPRFSDHLNKIVFFLKNKHNSFQLAMQK